MKKNKKIIVFLLTLFISTMPAMAQESIANLLTESPWDEMKHSETLKRKSPSFDIYAQTYLHPENLDYKILENRNVLAGIENVLNKQYNIVDFTLDTNTTVYLFSQGEQFNVSRNRTKMCDFVGIEHTKTGQIIWEMFPFETEHAGGNWRNRKVIRKIPLTAGQYRLHYRTDATHSFGEWEFPPPKIPYWGVTLYDGIEPTDEQQASFWIRTNNPERFGWSNEKLKEFEEELEIAGYSAFMIITDGKVVFEWGNIMNNFRSHSIRKSLISALYGIYIEEGKIDLSKTLEDLGIDDYMPLTKTEKKATVLDLLRSRSGVYIPATAEVRSMHAGKPARGSHEPGTYWYYNNWDFNVLGTIFEQETGTSIFEAFMTRIAQPIGMQDFSMMNMHYSYGEKHIQHPKYAFRLSARDLARFGQLFLNKGKWQGKQIVPEKWVEESTRTYSQTQYANTGYGYLWWTFTSNMEGIKKDSYYASGYGGQTILVLPHMKTVIVSLIDLSSHDFDEKMGYVNLLLLLKAVESYDLDRISEVDVAISEEVPVSPKKQLLADPYKVKKQTFINPLYRTLLYISVFVFLAALVIWPFVFFLHKYIKYKTKGTVNICENHRLARHAKVLAGISAVLNLFSISGLLKYSFVTKYGLPSGIPLSPLEIILANIPLVNIFLVVGLMIFTFLSWKLKYWHSVTRLHYTLVMLASLLLLILCAHWNIIGLYI